MTYEVVGFKLCMAEIGISDCKQSCVLMVGDCRSDTFDGFVLASDDAVAAQKRHNVKPVCHNQMFSQR